MVRSELEKHPIHKVRPIGDPYVFGLWHKNRISWRGYALEARVHAKGLLRRTTPKKFLIVGRPRSGTKLLSRLLDQVGGIHCDGEVLHNGVLAPRAFLNRLASIKTADAYGAKLITYQMFEVQRIRDHLQFFQRLSDDGFHLIHIRRNTFSQSLSLSVAQTISQYHIGTTGPAETRTLRIDPQDFVAQVLWNSTMLDYEDLLFSHLPHIRIDYDTDLADPNAHQPTVDRICQALSLPSGPVKADLQRTGARTVVENIEDLREALQKAGHGDVLPAKNMA